MRLSAGQLEEHIKGILEGVLLWASDSKNRFKLKARTPSGSSGWTGSLADCLHGRVKSFSYDKM